MAYTKYSLTPANNTATPPDGAPEGMLPSAVNDTMRDMMAQIRDCGDGIRDGTYTMTAAKITGGTITGVTFTGNTFSNPTITGVSTFAAGTVSAPAITTTGDTDTGIFFPAANTVAASTDGTERMRIDSSGNLGLGVTPSAWASTYRAIQVGAGGSIYGRTGSTVSEVNVVSNAYFDTTDNRFEYIGTGLSALYQQSDGTHRFYNAPSGTAGAALTFTERMRITSDGEVLVGGTTAMPEIFSGLGSAGLQIQKNVGGSLAFFRNDTTVSGGNNFGVIGFFGNDTTSNNPTLHAYIGAEASSTHAAGDNPTDIVFGTTPDGSATVAERMRITSGGEVLIGGTTAISSVSGAVNIERAGTPILSFFRNDTSVLSTNILGAIQFWGNDTTSNTPANLAYIYCIAPSDHAAGDNPTNLAFGTTPDGSATVTERLRILENGSMNFNTGDVSGNPNIFMRTGSNTVLTIDRFTDDGTLVAFAQANTIEGNISVSGTTVSYNGGHLSRYAQTLTPKDDSLLKGTVLSNLDDMNEYVDAEGNPVANEQLNKVKVSDVEGDVNVAGVFVNWSHDEQHNVDEINMAMTGDMIIRIAQGVVVQKGDLLMSAGDGTAKPQGDDIVRSKTIAKVTSNHVTCTYADGSYCVPCVLMAC